MHTKTSQKDTLRQGERLLPYEVVTATSLSTDLHVMSHGAMIYCTQGTGVVVVNLDRWKIGPDNVLTLFPGDTVRWESRSEDLSLELINYTSEQLREASLNIEHAVYSLLRTDRVCYDRHISRCVAGTTMRMVRYYYMEQQCESIDRIVVLQLAAFFLGFHDAMIHKPGTQAPNVSARTDELFGQFVRLVEKECHEQHEVKYYANKLCITPKYLSIITKRKANLSPKRVIDENIILKIKLALRTTPLTTRQLTDEFFFTDSSFFVRYFKAHTGLSPQAYRQSASSSV